MHIIRNKSAKHNVKKENREEEKESEREKKKEKERSKIYVPEAGRGRAEEKLVILGVRHVH